jgi:two-component system, OmpR family, response regulator
VLPPPHRVQPPRGALRVLVVEDSPDAADSLAMVLSLGEYRVTLAASGPAALEQAEAEEPDVVLLDLGLPGMDGCEVAKRLGADPPGRRPFLIAITGYSTEEYRRLSAEAGIDLHLVKPVDPDFLLRLLQGLAHGTCEPATRIG